MTTLCTLFGFLPLAVAMGEGAEVRAPMAITVIGGLLVSTLLTLLVIPVVVFYLLRDWDLMLARVQELLPRAVAPTATRLARDSDSVLGAFLRGQLLVMLLLAVALARGAEKVCGVDIDEEAVAAARTSSASATAALLTASRRSVE